MNEQRQQAQLHSKLRSVLVANRGEIAVRIFRTAREQGLRTVAVFAEDDALCVHRRFADEAFLIPSKHPQQTGIESYLDIEAIIAIAKHANVDAIHPGYGFLSENERFARACQQAGIIFIGPNPEPIKMFGDKNIARDLARAVNVTVVPGTDKVTSLQVKQFVSANGLPIILKASRGGGGRGVRIVRKVEEIDEFYRQCASEAMTAFGDESIFVERYIEQARHVEIQIIADQHGAYLALGDRDCSPQRRHQKVLEVAPCLGLDPAIRARMASDALKICSKAGITSLATVEFLVPLTLHNPTSPPYYFLEVNPRIQVEHGVTEEIVGVDLVQLQLLISAGVGLHHLPQPFPRLLVQYPSIINNVYNTGKDWTLIEEVAIQLRVTVDDPADGVLMEYTEPGGVGVRVDSIGYVSSRFNTAYDPLLAKVIVKGGSFEAARVKALRAVSEFRISGVVTSLDLLTQILQSAQFWQHKFYTSLLSEWGPRVRPMTLNLLVLDLYKYLAVLVVSGKADDDLLRGIVWSWSNSTHKHETNSNKLREAFSQGAPVEIVLGGSMKKALLVSVVSVAAYGGGSVLLSVDGQLVCVPLPPQMYQQYQQQQRPTTGQSSQLAAVVTGGVYAATAMVIKKVLVNEGQAVIKNKTPILAVSVMKMEQTLYSDVDGQVTHIHVTEGGAVPRGTLLITITPPTAQSKVGTSSSPSLQRVINVKDHLTPSWRKNLRTLPQAEWQKDVDEFSEILQVGEQNVASGVARQKQQGKYTARERIALLVDHGSWREFGALAGKPKFDKATGKLLDFTPANCISGRGSVKNRAAVVIADDFAVRGGHADGSIVDKQKKSEEMARQLRVPVIRLLDGSSGGGSVALYFEHGFTYVPRLYGWTNQIQQLSEIPVVAALLGPVVGLGAARAMASHFSVMVKGLTQMFAAGPPVVHQATGDYSVTKESLGGWTIHGTNGSVDNVVENEEAAIEEIKKFLSYMPSNAWTLPPFIPTHDPVDRMEDELLSLIPRDRHVLYDPRRLIELVADKNSFFEIGRLWGGAVVTGLARIGGYVVGIIANDSSVDGGALGALSSHKLRRHVDLCSAFHIPVVDFVDQPGFVIGVEAERDATLRHGASAMTSLIMSHSPFFTCIVRRAFGVAGAAVAARYEYDMRVGWPSGDWGSLPVEGGIEAAFKRQLQEASDPVKLRKEINEKIESVRKPVRSAMAFDIEDLIDPRETRPLIAEWVSAVYARLSHHGQLQPVLVGAWRP